MTGSCSPCGACKFLRRKCVLGCVFAPYFCHEQGASQFAAIHKVFGASNASKLLSHLPVSERCDAAITISYEAQARLRDPIYGCVAHIFALQQQVMQLQAQLAFLQQQAAETIITDSFADADPTCGRSYPEIPSQTPQDLHAWFTLGRPSIETQISQLAANQMIFHNEFIDQNNELTMGSHTENPAISAEDRSSRCCVRESWNVSMSHPLDMEQYQPSGSNLWIQEEDLRSVALGFITHS